ncbi:tRNA (cytosine(72)-C(5))-methyltransferase NSUN6 isoform X1 [Nematostella vectensis]|uniref:tRNA (cytosine(72)-C(5))-methyltransferase NSUN6 isoform X1 n=1 Tax=Nematostella vectensis TaxID=45351 RepID=UPI00138FD581|nr:tRNA (cytosine(72)-C(5))-methyltransferase NSUN6 isoform X1 [Nematostella vectensis]
MNCLPKLRLPSEVEDYLRKSLSSIETPGESEVQGFDRLLSCLGQPPLFTTVRVNTLLVTISEAKEQLEQALLKQYSERERPCLEVTVHHSLPDVLVIKGSGPHLDLPKHTKQIIVDTHCGTAVLRGADVFAPGVIGAHPGIQSEDDVSVFADLDKQCRRGCSKPYNGSTLFVGNGKAVMSRSDIFCTNGKLSGIAVRMCQPLYDCPSLSGVLTDVLFLQNLPSAVVGHILGPQSGESVLDMCAAPGGKTCHIAALMKNKGLIVAFDKSQPKIQKIIANCEMQKVSIVKTHVIDASKALDTKAAPSSRDVSTTSPPYPPEAFDRILLDAPCSALGQRPQSVVHMKLKELQSFPKLQRKIFSSAVGLLRPGGTLVYSTCTITPEENEKQVAWALRSFPGLRLVPQVPHLGGPGFPDCGLSDHDRGLVQRFDPTRSSVEPCCDVDTIGFFIAKFVKS